MYLVITNKIEIKMLKIINIKITNLIWIIPKFRKYGKRENNFDNYLKYEIYFLFLEIYIRFEYKNNIK